MKRMRELVVIPAVLIGAIAGWFLGGGDVQLLRAVFDNPQLPTTDYGMPLVLGAVGALALPWLVNRWIELRTRPSGTPGEPAGR